MDVIGVFLLTHPFSYNLMNVVIRMVDRFGGKIFLKFFIKDKKTLTICFMSVLQCRCNYAIKHLYRVEEFKCSELFCFGFLLGQNW
jgi:fucose permease